VFGYIKRLDDDKKHVVAFAMRHVTDFNEITFHMYDVIHAALSMQKVRNLSKYMCNSPYVRKVQHYAREE
jgi:hypothetical protein